MKPIRNIICLDQISFDCLMEDKGWTNVLPHNIAAISICSHNANEEYTHWFKTDWKTKGHGVYHEAIFNLDIDDCGPFWFGIHESKCYDDALDLYNNGDLKMSNAYFSHFYISGKHDEFCNMIHVMDYEEAFDLVNFIDKNIKDHDTIYIHCAAGASRSQGVVRYILDTYGNDYELKTNPNNPCITPNAHVCMMLKRAYRQLFNNIDEDYFNTKLFDKEKFDEFTKDIKLNIL